MTAPTQNDVGYIPTNAKELFKNNLCPEIVTPEWEKGFNGDRQLDRFFPDQARLRSYCMSVISKIDHDIQRIVKGKLSKHYKLNQGRQTDIDYRYGAPSALAVMRMAQYFNRTLRTPFYHELDPDWHHPSSAVRIRYLGATIFGVNSEIEKHTLEVDAESDTMYTPTYLGFAMLDHDLSDIIKRPYLNRKNRKFIEIRYKRYSKTATTEGLKLDWSLVPTLAPFLIERRAKTAPGRFKDAYRKRTKNEGGYVINANKPLNEQMLRLKLSRVEYMKVVRAIDSGGDHDFCDGKLQWLTSICRRVFEHNKSPQEANMIDFQSVFNRAHYMQHKSKEKSCPNVSTPST